MNEASALSESASSSSYLAWLAFPAEMVRIGLSQRCTWKVNGERFGSSDSLSFATSWTNWAFLASFLACASSSRARRASFCS